MWRPAGKKQQGHKSNRHAVLNSLLGEKKRERGDDDNNNNKKKYSEKCFWRTAVYINQ